MPATAWAMARIFGAPIVMLGKELFLNPTRFVVVGETAPAKCSGPSRSRETPSW